MLDSETQKKAIDAVDGMISTLEKYERDMEESIGKIRKLLLQLTLVLGDDDDHDCHLDKYGMGHCDHPIHDRERIGAEE